MTEHTKRMIAISIFVGLLIVLLLLILFFRSKQNEPTVVVPNPVNIPEERDLSTISESEVIAPQPVQDIPRTVVPGTADQGIVAKQAARTFVERFGTHSSQNDNVHIDTVASLVTPSMWEWVRNQGDDQSLRVYTGMMTEIIASTLIAFTDTTATVSIQAKVVNETETDMTTQNREGRVDLVRVGDRWLVDGFYWDT